MSILSADSSFLLHFQLDRRTAREREREKKKRGRREESEESSSSSLTKDEEGKKTQKPFPQFFN